MNLTQRFTTKQSLWERFQALHILLVQAGYCSEWIYLHPDSLEALTIEMAPRTRGEVFDPPLITGAVTAVGQIKILADESGIVL